MDIPNPLLQMLRRQRVSLFIGAGVSSEAGFPTGPELAVHLANAAGAPHSVQLVDMPLDHVSQYLYKQPDFGKLWVREQIIELFRKLHVEVPRPPSEGHQVLTEIKWRSVFTTNFDRLVEISYDVCAGAVQACLPVYEPDPQIQMHDSHVVRVVKLNGSVDEAERSIGHELVLTFAEQQNARHRNDQFYRLLQDEAINGPIVFIGYGLTHPGASSPGTSPDFLVLQQVLRDLGNTGRTHYCVVPPGSHLAENQLERAILEDARVNVIAAEFSTFMAELKEQHGRAAEALRGRPDIIVPVGSQHLAVLADENDQDLRQFELLHEGLLDTEPPTVAESLDGEPNWGSFREGHYIDRRCRGELLEGLAKCRHTAPSLLVLSAPLGWGKSFMLRSEAMRSLQERVPTFWLNPLSTMEVASGDHEPVLLGSWDAHRIDDLLARISRVHGGLSEESPVLPILIADECAERVPELLSLFRSLEANGHRFVLLVALSDVEFAALRDEHPLLQKACVVEPDSSTGAGDELRALIHMCVENGVGALDRQTDEETLARRLIEQGADQALILALQVIFDGRHRPFEEIVKEQWNSLESETARDVSLRVALLHQHGNLFSPRTYTVVRSFGTSNMPQVLDAIRDCLSKRLLQERVVQEEPCASLLHPLISQKLIAISGHSHAELDERLLHLASCMTGNVVDLELLRRFLKRVNDYSVGFAGEEAPARLFREAAESTNNDWVVCQQYTKYLVRRDEYESAYAWAKRALEKNPNHSSLHHTLGNVLSKWGMELLNQGRTAEANRRLKEARDSFANSRVGREPDEYGYVTHLDMLLSIREQEPDPQARAALNAEGISLYREGLRSVPEEKYNWLLFDRYRRNFDPSETEIRDVVERLEMSLREGQLSLSGVMFLAEYFASYELYEEAERVLRCYLDELAPKSVAAWTKLAETEARKGDFREASRSIDTAKSHVSSLTNWEQTWALHYWDLLISVARSQYREAGRAIGALRTGRFLSRQTQPRGYVWRREAMTIPRDHREFRRHGKIFEGRIYNLRAGGATGFIRLINPAGEYLDVEFVRRYFTRGDFRKGNPIRFVMELLPSGLRAADPSSRPFLNTIDDLYV